MATPELTVDKAYLVLLLVLLGPIALPVIGTVLAITGTLPPPADLPAIIPFVLGGAAAVVAAASFVVRRILLANPPADAGVQWRMSRSLIGMAMAENPMVLGFVLLILTGDLKGAGVLWGLGFAAMVFHLPSKAWLAGE
jgi:hypothetical protein